MIAYHVLCHSNLSQVVEQVRALDAPDTHFLIDIDDGCRPDLSPLDAFRGRTNVRVRTDANIGWGGAGTLRKTIEGAFALLDAGPWRYYVVLSGQDLPLKPNTVIHERLARGDASGTSFIACHAAEPTPLPPPRRYRRRPPTRLWEDRGHTRVYARAGTIGPLVHMDTRRRVDVTETGEAGDVHVGRADPLLARRREAFFARHPFHTGPNWFSLHRSLVEHMRADPFARELYDVMRTTFIPDESYFQTYVMASAFRERVDPDHGRLILRPPTGPVPKVFDAHDWPVIRDSDALFGRKFDTQRHADVVERVLEARAA